MSVMRDLTPAILSAAVGIMASYTSVSAADVHRQSPGFSHQQSQEELAVAQSIHEFIKSCRVMEQRYRAAVKDVCELPASELAAVLTATELAEFTEHLQQIRNIETLLRTIRVPEQFAALHGEARKALAKGRSYVALLHDLTMQAIRVPTTVPGEASPDGLKALAGHSTKRLVELANA